jgi:hypothetical protein
MVPGRGDDVTSNLRPIARCALAWVAAVAAALAAAAQAQDAPAPTPAPTPTPTPPAASPAPRRRVSIREVIDRHVEQVLRAREAPCERASRAGVPCFPVDVEREGPRFSVADALRHYRTDGTPAPGVPTNAELRQQLTGAPRSAAGGVSTDPVCAVKSLVRWISGKPTRFYLYRLKDERGVRPLLADRKLEPSPRPDLQYEFIGEFKGECEAVAAWRAALREDVAPPPYDYTHLPKAESATDTTPPP